MSLRLAAKGASGTNCTVRILVVLVEASESPLATAPLVELLALVLAERQPQRAVMVAAVVEV
jgi:hypothetical protein